MSNTIEAPTPIVVGTVTSMWIRRLHLSLPPGQPGKLIALLHPFAGSVVLATGVVELNIADVAAARAADSAFDACITNLLAEIVRQRGSAGVVKEVTVHAPSPAEPVRAVIRFVEGAPLVIPSCYALAGSDTTFAGVFIATRVALGLKAGLTVV